MTDRRTPPARKIGSLAIRLALLLCLVGIPLGMIPLTGVLAQSATPPAATPAPAPKATTAPAPAAQPSQPASQVPAATPTTTHAAPPPAPAPQAAAPAAVPPPAATAKPSDKITQGDIERLIRTLDDGPGRERLKKQLQLLLQAQRGASGQGATAAVTPQGFGQQLLASLSHHVESVSNVLVNLVEAIVDLPQRARQVLTVLSNPERRAYWLDVAFDLVGVLAIAFAIGWATRRLLTRPTRALAARGHPRWFMRLLFLPLMFVAEALPVLAFATASYLAMPLFDPSEAARLIISAVIGAQIAASLATAIANALFAPRAPGLRVFRLGDETAAYLQVWVRRLAVVTAYGYAITELAALLGIDPALHEVITRIWGLLIAAMAVIFVLQNRAAVAAWIAGPADHVDTLAVPDGETILTPLEPDPRHDAAAPVTRFRIFRRQFGRIWHVLAIAYIIAGYVVWSLQIEGGFAFLLRATVLTGILLLVLRLADRFLRQAFDRSVALPEELKRILPGLEQRTNRFLPVLKQTVLVAIYLAGAFALLQIWGLDVIGWVSEGSGRPVIAASFKIIIIVALSALASELVNLAIEHYLRERDQAGRRIYHSGRIRTLLPLLRNAFRLTLGTLVLLVVLSEIGIDIGPLLAAAGVVGLAIGFGAQTLVKDIITGVFILMEDTIAIGDIVDLGGHAGVVEGMTIRTIRLRDGAGTVHTVPFSAVTIVQNLTKDFSYATLDIKVDYRENIDDVIAVMKQAAAEIEKDPDIKYGTLGPIEIIGLDGFLDTGVLIKARMKTRAMSQWSVMRAFNLELKRAFDARGMRFPGVMAPMPSVKPTMHEISIKDGNAAALGGLPASEGSDGEEMPPASAKTAAPAAPKAADAQAKAAEGAQPESPPVPIKPPSSPR